MTKQNTIAITGANGLLGSALMEHFSGLDWNIIALVRHASNYKNIKGVTYVEYSLEGPIDDKVLAGVDFVVHAAFAKQTKKSSDAYRINVQAAKNLLKASRKMNVRKNIFMSSMSAHSKATSTYGKQKLAIEKLFNTSKDASIRSGLIIGDGGIVKDMAMFMKSKHVVPIIDKGNQPLQIIATYDLARVIEALCRKSLSGTFTVATPTIYSYKDFYTALGKRYHLKFIFLPLPFGLLRLALRTVSALHLPIKINEDNLLGLKNLRSFNTQNDLNKIAISIDPLEKALENTTLSW